MSDAKSTHAGVPGFLNLRNAFNVARWDLRLAECAGRDLQDLRSPAQLASGRDIEYRMTRARREVKRVARIKRWLERVNDRAREQRVMRYLKQAH